MEDRKHVEERLVATWLERAFGAVLPRGRFARSISVLVGGTAVGQGIAALASPILTRLYGPDDFGVMAVYVSLLSILSVMATMRYQLAIPLPEKDEEAANLVALSLVIVVLMSTLVGGGAWLLGDQLMGWVNSPGLRPHVWALPLGVGLVGFYGVFSYWAVRKQAFGDIALTKVNQGLGAVLTEVGLGVLLVGPIGLLLGQIVGRAAGTTTLAAKACRQDARALAAVKPEGIFRVALRYRRFPFFSSWSAIFNTLSSQIPTLLLSSYFGSWTTGLFSLSYRVVALPTSLVGQAAAKVFFPEAVGANRDGVLAATTDRVFRQLLRVAAPVLMLIVVAAPEVFAGVFGEEWREGGTYAQWLAPWLFLVFISSPLSMLPSVLEKQKQEAFFNALLLSSRVVAVLIGGFLNNARAAIALFAGVSVLGYFGFVVWNMGLSGHRMNYVIRSLFSEVAAAVPLVLPLILAKVVVGGGLVVLAAGVLSAILIAYRVASELRSGVIWGRGLE